jgi:osmotically-inducible protein OsmY
LRTWNGKPIDETQIGVVIVRDGIVTLSGIVCCVKKQEAENGSQSVVGVKGVAEDRPIWLPLLSQILK